MKRFIISLRLLRAHDSGKNAFAFLCKAFMLLFLVFNISFYAKAQVDEIGPRSLKLNLNGNTLRIPYFADYQLDSTNPGIRKDVIVIHGMDRNAGDYYRNIKEAASMSSHYTDSLMVIAPQFLIENDLDPNHLDASYLYWSSGWKSGSNSKNNPGHPRPARISSYSVLDTLMMRLVIYHPNLKYIVFAGHSAGGQLTNRYSASSPIVDKLFNEYGIKTRFIVANPSSYLYLDDKRVVSGTVNQFGVPSAACSGYNHWRYGLDNLYSYPDQFGTDSIRHMLKRREVIYLLGGNDTDETSSSLDQSCKAELQGKNRLERGSVYYNYLLYYYGAGIATSQKIDTVPGVGHDNYDMFASPTGRYWLFMSEPGIGTLTAVKPVNDLQLKVFPNPTRGLFRVQLKNNKSGTAVYSLYDMKGNILVKHQNFSGNSCIINLKKLLPGPYLLVINKEKQTVRKLIYKLQ